MMKQILTAFTLLLFLGCASATTRREGTPADGIMEEIRAAIETACQTGQTQQVKVTNVESLIIAQGGQISSPVGGQQIHSFSGDSLKSLQQNISNLRPDRPVMVSISIRGEEFEGGLRNLPCAVRVPAMTLSGGTITVEPDSSQTLVMSAYQGERNTVEKLIAGGADVNRQNRVSPLMAASDGGHLEIVELLLARGARLNDRADFNGKTALHFAVEKGYLDIAGALLHAGANKEITDVDGFTPLWGAAYRNQTQSIEFLLKNGANINHLDQNGNNLLASAAAAGSNDVIRMLIRLGINADNRNKFNRTALFDAIEHGHPETVRLLIQQKVDLNIRTASGKTPLIVARQSGNPEIVQMLEASGAK